MSATEVIEEIKKLPAEERKKVVEFVHALEEEEGKNSGDIDAGFKKVAEEVFSNNEGLFRKLAQ